MIGQWKTFKNLEAARPEIIAILKEVRDMLKDLGSGLGLADPVTGKAASKRHAAASARSPEKKRSAKITRKAKRRTNTKQSSAKKKRKRKVRTTKPRATKHRHNKQTRKKKPKTKAKKKSARRGG